MACSVSVFVGGLWWEHWIISVEEATETVRSYLERRTGFKGRINVGIRANLKSAVVEFRSEDRRATCKAALETETGKPGGTMATEREDATTTGINFAEIRLCRDEDREKIEADARVPVEEDRMPERLPVVQQPVEPARRWSEHADETWSRALEPVASRRRCHGFGRALIWNKLELAALVCRQAGDWRVWAYDLPLEGISSGAPKRYLAATTSAFEIAYRKVPPEKRHAYEIIDAERPCYAYLDLERHGDVDADDVARKVCDAMSLVLRRGDENVVVDALVLDSCRPGKYSQHVICRTFDARSGRPKPLPGSTAAGRVARVLKAALPAGLADVVDPSVYTQNRCFRLLGSSKIGTDTHLTASYRLRYEPGAAPQKIVNNVDALSLLDTLVVPSLNSATFSRVRDCLRVPDDDANLLVMHPLTDATNTKIPKPQNAAAATLFCTADELSQQTAPSRRRRLQTADCESRSATASATTTTTRFLASTAAPPRTVHANSRNGDTENTMWTAEWRGATETPLLDLIEANHPFVFCRAKDSGLPPPPFRALALEARNLARTLPQSSDADVRCWTYVAARHPPERYLHLTLKNTRYCHCRGRPHKNQNVILTVDPSTGQAWQRCHDSTDCRRRAFLDDGAQVVLRAKHPLPRRLPDCPLLADLVDFELDNELAFAAAQQSTHNTKRPRTDLDGGGDDDSRADRPTARRRDDKPQRPRLQVTRLVKYESSDDESISCTDTCFGIVGI